MNSGMLSSAGATRTLVWQPESIVVRAPLEQLYPSPQPFEVEVGSGDGGFILAYAKVHPEHNFLAIERLLGRLRKIDRKGLRAGLTNLRALRLEASYTVGYLLPPASVTALHVYFPDPWPKRRHRHRRLIEPGFLGAVCRALQPGGRLYLRTDDPDYFAQMREGCDAVAELRLGETPTELAGFVTDFERYFQAAGQPIHRLAYERR